MKQKKIWLLVISVLLLGLMLTACGGGSNTEAEATTAPVEVSQEDTAVDEPAYGVTP